MNMLTLQPPFVPLLNLQILQSLFDTLPYIYHVDLISLQLSCSKTTMSDNFRPCQYEKWSHVPSLTMLMYKFVLFLCSLTDH